MAAEDGAGQWVTLNLPDWLWGGDTAEFARRMRWTVSRTPAVDAWNVRLRERGRRHSDLLKVDLLARSGNVDSPGAYARLRTLTTHPGSQTARSMKPSIVNPELDRLSRKEGLGPALYRLTLATLSAPPAQLPEIIKQGVKSLLDLDGLDRGAAAYLISVDPAVHLRSTATRILLLLDDPATSPSLTAAVNQSEAEFASPLKSARGLSSDTLLGLGAYLAPLFLSVSPYVWGAAAPRPGGVIVFTLGTAVVGREGHAAEPLQLFQPRGPSMPGFSRPELTAAQLDTALRWYVQQLAELFTEATDPANFIDANQNFVPRRQFETLLSIEQLFRNVQSLGAQNRDLHAQRVLLMDTLDALQGLRQLDFASMTRLSRAREELALLESAIPPEAQPVLLTRARKAVQALEDLQLGFFLRLTDGGVLLPDKSEGTKTFSLEESVSLWLRVLRNAGHAFGGKNDNGRSRDEALLLAHDGEIPPDLGSLAWLYLLRLLCRPERLRFSSRSSTS